MITRASGKVKASMAPKWILIQMRMRYAKCFIWMWIYMAVNTDDKNKEKYT